MGHPCEWRLHSYLGLMNTGFTLLAQHPVLQPGQGLGKSSQESLLHTVCCPIHGRLVILEDL